MSCLRLPTGGLCCFVLLHQAPSHPLSRPRPSSVCQVFFAPRLSLLTVCAFYPFFHLPEHYSLSLSVFLFIARFFPFHLYLFILSAARIYLTPPSSSPPPAFAVLWRPTEAIRTDGLRWFPGSTHFHGKQPGTAAGMMLSQGVCRSNTIRLQCSSKSTHTQSYFL